MSNDKPSKWYGKIIFDNEGIETYSEHDTKEAAEAFVNGFLCAKKILENGDCQDNQLEDYWVHVDQIEPEDK